jgi:hypothetical protein
MRNVFNYKKILHNTGQPIFASFPSWSGVDATNWNMMQTAIDQRLQIQQNSTIDSYSSINLNTSFSNGNDHVFGCLAPNNCIYYFPLTANKKILKINTNNDTHEFIGDNLSVGYSGCVLHPNGYIYAVPANSGPYLRLDPSTDNVHTLINTSTSGLGSSAGYNAFHAVLGPNNKIYSGKSSGVEVGSSDVYDVDLNQETYVSVPVPNPNVYGSIPRLRASYRILLSANNNLYQVSDVYHYFLSVINPSDNSFSYSANLGNGGTFWSSRTLNLVASYGNKLYIITNSNSGINDAKLISYDVSNNSITNISSAEINISGTLANGTFIPNGHIYFLSTKNTSRYYKLNVSTNEITPVIATNVLTSGNPRVNSLKFAPNGKMYHVYGGKIHILNITNAEYPSDFCMSRYFNC